MTAHALTALAVLALLAALQPAALVVGALALVVEVGAGGAQA